MNKPHLSIASPPAHFDSTEPGYERVWPFPFDRDQGNGQSFVSGDSNGQGLRVNYYRKGSEMALIARVWFGPKAGGPPGFAHGGSMTAVLDEVMGGLAWLTGHTVVAARLVTNFRDMLPIGTVAVAEGVIERMEGKKVFTKGTLKDALTGRVFAEGEGLFIILSPEKLETLKTNALTDGPLPERKKS